MKLTNLDNRTSQLGSLSLLNRTSFFFALVIILLYLFQEAETATECTFPVHYMHMHRLHIYIELITGIPMGSLQNLNEHSVRNPEPNNTTRIFWMCCPMALLLISETHKGWLVLCGDKDTCLRPFFSAGTFSSSFSELEDTLRMECLSKTR